MVTELQEVLKRVEQLNEDEQKSIAKLLDQEISWQGSFETSQDKLSWLANEAIDEYKSGKSTQTDW